MACLVAVKPDSLCPMDNMASAAVISDLRTRTHCLWAGQQKRRASLYSSLLPPLSPSDHSFYLSLSCHFAFPVCIPGTTLLPHAILPPPVVLLIPFCQTPPKPPPHTAMAWLGQTGCWFTAWAWWEVAFADRTDRDGDRGGP